MNKTPQDVNRAALASTSDGIPTHDEWLDRVLFSGVVDKVAQHLALVIYAESGGNGILRASVRDLERLTGWSRSVIAENLRALEPVADIVYGVGRSKTRFRLSYAPEPEGADFIEVVTAESKANLRLGTIEEFGHVCSHCDRQGDDQNGPDDRPWCLDRIIPGAVGGKYQADNVTLSCWACNSRRGASPIERRVFSVADWRALRAEWLDVGISIAEVCHD
jgi:hypothetical protein